jgi:hypothetical protein
MKREEKLLGQRVLVTKWWLSHWWWCLIMEVNIGTGPAGGTSGGGEVAPDEEKHYGSCKRGICCLLSWKSLGHWLLVVATMVGGNDLDRRSLWLLMVAIRVEKIERNQLEALIFGFSTITKTYGWYKGV